jgi:hypothetical protein
MGIRGEIFSTKVLLQNRSYFFNVKENRTGDIYLNIVESKNRESGGFDRQSVILFAEDLREFLKGFDESLQVLERAVRDKRRSSWRPTEEHERQDRNGREAPRSFKKAQGSDKYEFPRGRRETGPAPARGRPPKTGPGKKDAGRGENRDGRNRQVVVKKRRPRTD